MSESADYPDYDEYRPVKKMKLDTALETTMETRDETSDDDEGWDDVYGEATEMNDKSGPKKEAIADGTLPVMLPDEESKASILSEEVAQGQKDQIVEDTVMTDQVFVEEAPHVMPGLDEPSTRVLDETSTTGNHLETGSLDVSTMPLASTSAATAIEDRASAQYDESNSKVLSAKTTEAHAVQDSNTEFIEAAAGQTADPNAEWELDSSADSSDSSSAISSDSDDDSDEDYPLLDPATAAKMLMAGDGEDEESADKKGKLPGDHQPRTTNEVKEEIIPRPEIEITLEMQVTVLGRIEGIVENSILIKGQTSGEYQVLEPGSVLCTQDRKVVGVVADLFGRVQQPMYSVLFSSSQEELMKELGLVPGAEISYVNNHSKFVFTQPLRGMKGTDASNIHDEEVGEDEIEFSDDEQEAEYKRQRKLAKKAGRGGLSRGAFNEGERIDTRTYGAPGNDYAHTHNHYVSSSDAPSASYGAGMNYDDESTGDGFYQPLKRPDNLAEMMGAPSSSRGTFERGRGRGRGDRGRGRGDRGRGRGGQRGGHNREQGRGNHNQQQHSAQHNTHGAPPSAAVPLNAYATPQQQYAQPTSASPQNYQFNGYTFQYGQAATQASHAVQQTPPGYAQYGAPMQQTGAHVNPAFYANYQQQAQPPQAWQAPPASYPQQFVTTQSGQPAYSVPGQYVQPAAAQYSPAQQQELAEVMRRLGHYQPG